MRFKTGLLVGFGAGYVLGARAGRERYEQIRRIASQAAAHPAVDQLVRQAVGVVDLARELAARTLEAGAGGLRDLAGNRAETPQRRSA
jgi:hypothetical protein